MLSIAGYQARIVVLNRRYNLKKKEKNKFYLSVIFNGWGTYLDILLRYGGHIFMLVLFDYP